MNEGFGGYYNETILHPLALVVLGILSLWMVLTPRRTALLPILILSCFISPAQRLVIVGLDFTMLKIMLLVGLFRVLVRGEVRIPRWGRMDSALMVFILLGTIMYLVRIGTFGAVVNRLGRIYDILGLYLLCRILLQDWGDLRAVIRCLMWLSLPVALLFVIERSTGSNMFAVFGGVPEITPIRSGKLRCTGAFAHPIIAGVFWAVVIPMFVPDFWRQQGKILPLLGVVACGLIIVATNSSTPLAAGMLVFMGFALYPFRHLFRFLFWGTLLSLTFIHFYREMPIWHLLSRIDLSGGSTGLHRYLLIQEAINTMGQWWMFGAQAQTFEVTVFRDVTNQYIGEAFRGGLMTLGLFFLVIALGFRMIWSNIRRTDLSIYQEMVVWGMGVALFVHSTVFMVLSYFAQGTTIWYLQLAIIASLPTLLDSETAKAERAEYEANRIQVQDLGQVRVWPVG